MSPPHQRPNQGGSENQKFVGQSLSQRRSYFMAQQSALHRNNTDTINNNNERSSNENLGPANNGLKVHSLPSYLRPTAATLSRAKEAQSKSSFFSSSYTASNLQQNQSNQSNNSNNENNTNNEQSLFVKENNTNLGIKTVNGNIASGNNINAVYRVKSLPTHRPLGRYSAVMSTMHNIRYSNDRPTRALYKVRQGYRQAKAMRPMNSLSNKQIAELKQIASITDKVNLNSKTLEDDSPINENGEDDNLTNGNDEDDGSKSASAESSIIATALRSMKDKFLKSPAATKFLQKFTEGEEDSMKEEKEEGNYTNVNTTGSPKPGRLSSAAIHSPFLNRISGNINNKENSPFNSPSKKTDNSKVEEEIQAKDAVFYDTNENLEIDKTKWTSAKQLEILQPKNINIDLGTVTKRPSENESEANSSMTNFSLSFMNEGAVQNPHSNSKDYNEQTGLHINAILASTHATPHKETKALNLSSPSISQEDMHDAVGDVLESVEFSVDTSEESKSKDGAADNYNDNDKLSFVSLESVGSDIYDGKKDDLVNAADKNKKDDSFFSIDGISEHGSYAIEKTENDKSINNSDSNFVFDEHTNNTTVNRVAGGWNKGAANIFSRGLNKGVGKSDISSLKIGNAELASKQNGMSNMGSSYAMKVSSFTNAPPISTSRNLNKTVIVQPTLNDIEKPSNTQASIEPRKRLRSLFDSPAQSRESSNAIPSLGIRPELTLSPTAKKLLNYSPFKNNNPVNTPPIRFSLTPRRDNKYFLSTKSTSKKIIDNVEHKDKVNHDIDDEFVDASSDVEENSSNAKLANVLRDRTSSPSIVKHNLRDDIIRRRSLSLARGSVEKSPFNSLKRSNTQSSGKKVKADYDYGFSSFEHVFITEEDLKAATEKMGKEETNNYLTPKEMEMKARKTLLYFAFAPSIKYSQDRCTSSRKAILTKDPVELVVNNIPMGRGVMAVHTLSLAVYGKFYGNDPKSEFCLDFKTSSLSNVRFLAFDTSETHGIEFSICGNDYNQQEAITIKIRIPESNKPAQFSNSQKLVESCSQHFKCDATITKHIEMRLPIFMTSEKKDSRFLNMQPLDQTRKITELIRELTKTSKDTIQNLERQTNPLMKENMEASLPERQTIQSMLNSKINFDISNQQYSSFSVPEMISRYISQENSRIQKIQAKTRSIIMELLINEYGDDLRSMFTEEGIESLSSHNWENDGILFTVDTNQENKIKINLTSKFFEKAGPSKINNNDVPKDSDSRFEPQEDESDCQLCFANKNERILNPCGHKLCSNCAERVISDYSACPWDRKKIISQTELN